VVFDVIFADANPDNADDRALAQAMKRVPTVLGAALGVSQRATINGAFLLEELLNPAEMFEAESVGVGVVGLSQRVGLVREFPRATSDVFPHVVTLAEMAVALDRTDAKPPPAGALLNFYGPSRSIPTIPYELVVSQDQGQLPQALFEGKVVFVGLGLRSSTGASQRDAFVTPFDEQTFGAEIHATAASNLLQADWINQPDAVVRSVIAIVCAASLSMVIISFTGLPFLGTLVGALGVLAVLQFACFVVGWFVPMLAASVWGVFSGLLLRLTLAQSSNQHLRRRL
jgi:CHASE2 domain-containing sensor protein